MPASEPEALALSHLRLRQGLGVIGLLMPVVLILAAFCVDLSRYRTSISAHYYAPNLDAVFIGSLCAIGVFLFYYRGYPNRDDAYVRRVLPAGMGRMAQRWLTDSFVTTLAGLGAIGTALFPTCLDRCRQPPEIACAEWLHYGCAALFLLALTYMSLFQFTRSSTAREKWETEKRRDNAIHTVCGVIMFGCLVVIALNSGVGLFDPKGPAVFWLEAVAVWAFAVSWLVKGRMLGNPKGLRQPAQASR